MRRGGKGAFSRCQRDRRDAPGNSRLYLCEMRAPRRGCHRAETPAQPGKSGRERSHYALAVIHAALGSEDAAFAELESAYAERAWSMLLLKRDPAFDGLRDDPRFVRLERRVG